MINFLIIFCPSRLLYKIMHKIIIPNQGVSTLSHLTLEFENDFKLSNVLLEVRRKHKIHKRIFKGCTRKKHR